MAAYDGSLLFNTKIDASGFEKLGSMAAKAAAKVTAAFTAAVTAAGMAGSNFEVGMSSVAAISLESAENMALLTAKAEEMGATTKFSATESAKAFEYMSMAGWKTDQMLSGISGIMDLAAASGEDLATVSDIVTDALTAFGMTAAESGKFSDILAAASSNANTNVAMMGESFKYAAPIFGALGYSAEDAAVAIGLMANAGIKGTQSGTVLRAAISSLAAPSNEAAEAMDRYKISLTDENGQMYSFAEVMVNLREKLGSLSEAEQTAAASTIFGTEAMSGMLAVINASEEDFNKLTDAIANSEGMTEKMAEIRLDNLQGDVTILKSGLEALGIAAYNKFSDPLRSAVQAVTGEVAKLTESIKNGELSASFEKVSTKLAELAGKLLEFAVNEGIPALINAFEWVIDNGEKVVSALETVAAGYATIKIMSWGAAAQAAIGGTTIAEQAGLMAASLANPVTVAVALAVALAAVGTAILGYKRNQLEIKNAEMAYPLREELDAVRDLQAAYEDIDQTAKKEAQSKIAETEHIKALKSELDRYVDINGKVISNRERVLELTEQINSIMPGTISLIEEEISNYQQASAAIDEFITKKQQEAVLDWKEAGYGEAKANVMDLAKEYAQVSAERERLSKEVLSTDKAYNEAYARTREELAKEDVAYNSNRELAYARADKEILDMLEDEKEELYILNKAREEAGAALGAQDIIWSEMKTTLDGYYSAIQEYEGLTAALAEGDTQAFNAILNGVKGFYGDYSEVSAEEISRNIAEMQGLVDEWTKENELGNIPTYMVEQAKNGLDETIQLAKDYIYTTGNAVEGVVLTAGEYYARYYGGQAAWAQSELAAALGSGGLSPELSEAANDLGADVADGISEGFETELDDLKFSLELGKITDDQFNQQLGALLQKYDSGQTKAYREYWSDFTRGQKNNAKESVSEINKDFEEAVSDLDFELVLGKIDDDTYHEKLGGLLNQYDSAQTKAYSNYWSRYYSWEEKKEDEDEQAALKEIETWQKASDKLISEYESRYAQIMAKRDSMLSKLSADSLYTKTDPDADEDDKDYDYNLADNSEQKKKLDEYEKLLKKLQGLNASEDFMNEFLSMDIDQALEFGKALSTAKGGSAAWLKGWQENRDREKQLADNYVQTAIDELNAEYEPQFQNLLDNVPNAFSEKGRQSLQGYIDGLNEKKEDADAAVVSVMDGVIKACEDKLEIHSPSKVMYEMGEYTADGFIEGLMSKSDAVYNAVMSVFGSAFDDVYAKMQAAVSFSMSAAAADVTAASSAPRASSSGVSQSFTPSYRGVSGNDYNLYLNNEYFGKMVRRAVSENGILTANSGGVY